MINPDCPHVIPALDGDYCPKCDGGPCQLSESEALAELVDKEFDLPIYKPDTSPETIEQGLREGWIQRTDNSDSQPKLGSKIAYNGREMIVYYLDSKQSHIWLMEPGATVAKPYPKEPEFSPGSKWWLLMHYHGSPYWTQFEIIDDDHAIGTVETLCGTVHDTLLLNDWFREHARKNPPENVSDSGNPRGSGDSQGADPADRPQNVSDSGSPRGSGDFWREARPYKSKGRLYYRYRWGRGAKIEGVKHIPGSNMASELGRSRAAAVHNAVYREGKSHGEVLELIRSWGRGKSRN